MASNNGTVGEQVAEAWFRRNGWVMERHQPPTRVVYVKGRPTVVHERSNGVADYTGYQWLDSCMVPEYRACEVKEVYGSNSMPASRLSKEQRAWMETRPQGTAFVAVVWMDGNPTCEVFPFVDKWSYKRAEKS
jgi:hypothetical protein